MGRYEVRFYLTDRVVLRSAGNTIPQAFDKMQNMIEMQSLFNHHPSRITIIDKETKQAIWDNRRCKT